MELDLEQLRFVFLALLGLIFATLGTLVVYLIVASRRSRRRMGRADSRSRPDQPRSVIPEEGTKATWIPPVGLPTGQVVAVFREGTGRALLVEVGGNRYRRLADIEDPNLRRQVVEAATDLVRFTGVLGVESIAPAPVDKTYSWREDLREEIRTQAWQAPGPEDEGVEERFLSLLSEIGPAPTPEKPSLASSLKQRRLARGTRAEPPRSVVDDIEAIVQRRVLLIPALSGRDLHVSQDSEGAVRFVFDGQDYEQLEDIPNMTAQQLVKDAIQEWDETT